MGVEANQWDFFIAHAGEDKATAEELYNCLRHASHVFLDTHDLLPGDDWDTKLQQALKHSRITIVLISNHTKTAYYQREEIAAALAMTRKDSKLHRVVPCFLDEESAQREDIPYGLRLKHSISVKTIGGLKKVAERLLELRKQMEKQPVEGMQIHEAPKWLTAGTTGFVGPTERGPARVPTVITSWSEYQQVFGQHTDPSVSFLSYSVQGFFENGGRRTYVARAMGPECSKAWLQRATEGEANLQVTALTPGAWGNLVSVSVQNATRVGFRLIVSYSRRDGMPQVVEDYDNLSCDPEGPNYVLDEITSKSTILCAAWTPDLQPPAKPRNVESLLAGGSDGAGLTVHDYIGDPMVPPDQRVGLASLEDVHDVSIVCISDHVHPRFDDTDQQRITNAIVDQCERLRDRFAILSIRSGEANVPNSRFRYSTKTSGSRRRLSRATTSGLPVARQIPE